MESSVGHDECGETAAEHRVHVTHVTASVSRMGAGLSGAMYGLATGLERAGVRVSVRGMTDAWSGRDRAASAIKDIETCETYGPSMMRFAPGLVKSMLDTNCDIVHLHGVWTYSSIACLRWASATKLPFIVSPQGMLDEWALRNARWKKKIASLLWEEGNLRRAHCLHALTEREAVCMRNLGFRNPICVIPNGVVLPETLGKKEGPGWRERLGLEKDALICVFLGRIHPKKGLACMLEGWRRSGHERWTLVVAGWDQGGHEAELRLLTRKLGLEGRVKFVGPVFGDDKTGLLWEGDAFVLPSQSEGLPLSVLEAWAHGLPVAMTDECNIPVGFARGAAFRILADGTGLEELFESSRMDREVMARNGADLISERFCWTRIAIEMKKVYGWMKGHSARPSSVSVVDV